VNHSLVAVVTALILGGCGGNGSPSVAPSDEIGSPATSTSEVASEAAPSCVAAASSQTPADATADPSEQRESGPMSEMSIGDLLRDDPRFERFGSLTERARSPGLGLSWIEIWDWSADRMGDNQDGVTVFVPTDAAFDALEPEVAAALADTDVANDLLYSLLGHHYVHRLYPSAEFEPGPQRTWSGTGSVELSLEPLAFGGCAIVETDLRLTNGIVHVIDGIVMPPEVRQALLDTTQ